MIYKNSIRKKFIRQKNLFHGSRFRRLVNERRGEQKYLLLGTLPRSGTHFARNLLVNYFTISSAGIQYSPATVANIASSNFQYDLFDINAEHLKSPIKSENINQNLHLSKSSLFDVTRTHLVYLPKLFSVFHTIHLRRNPADFFTSYFQYMFLKRGHTFSDQLFWDVYNSKKNYYQNMINSYDNAKGILIYDYDDLINEPGLFLRRSLAFLGETLVNEQAISKAIAAASVANTLKVEASNQRVNPTAQISGSFMNIGVDKFELEQKYRDIIQREIPYSAT